MQLWPLILALLVAGLGGLLSLDWSALLGNPALQELRAMVSRLAAHQDIEATVLISGWEGEPVGLRITVLPGEGVFRLEFISPRKLSGQIFTYRRGLLTHYRPWGGGIRFVRSFSEEGIPRVGRMPGVVRAAREVLGAGWGKLWQYPELGLPGFGGSPPPRVSPTLLPPILPPLPGVWRLEIRDLPKPLEEVTLWYREGADFPERIGVVIGGKTVDISPLEVDFDRGLTLHQVLKLPETRATLWYP